MSFCKTSVVCGELLIHYLLYSLQRKRLNRCMELINVAIGLPFDGNKWFAMNGLSETHFVANAVLKLNGDMKLSMENKLKFVQFVVCFNGNGDVKVEEEISRLVEGLDIAEVDFHRLKARTR